MIQVSKLGVGHNAITQGAEMVDFHRRAQTCLVKVLEPNPWFVAAVREASPTSTISGRELGDLPDPVRYPVEAAKARFDQISHRPDYHLIEWWEGFNEGPTGDPEAFAAMAVFEYYMAQYLHDDGKKYVALSWGEGQPPMYWDDESPEGKAHPWQFFVDTMAKVFLSADACGVHGYGAPRMFSPGMEAWHLLRFRFWHDRLPPELKPDIWIPELGVDGGAVDESGGFRRWCTIEEYIADLIRCDLILRTLPYVKKTAIYVWGTVDPQWDSFDLRGSPVTMLLDYLISQLVEGGGVTLPDWILDVRDEVNYDTGLTRASSVGIIWHHDGIICPWQNSLAYLKRGTDQGSYHLGITPEGQTLYLNDLRRVVWNARDGYNGKWNRGGIAVLLWGYFMSGVRPTNPQLVAARQLLEWLSSLDFQVGTEVVPHHAVAATLCPGTSWWPIGGPVPKELLKETDELAELRLDVTNLRYLLGGLVENVRHGLALRVDGMSIDDYLKEE